MGKVSGQNSFIQFFHKYHAKGKKSSETAIISEWQRMGRNPSSLNKPYLRGASKLKRKVSPRVVSSLVEM
jgi:hypothetical protein